MKLFHVSEEPDIKVFTPRISPQSYTGIKGKVVFAVNDKMLHNYLLPRDCPRVTYFAKRDTSAEDIEKFIHPSKTKYIVNVESIWLNAIENTKLYLYEFDEKNFELLDGAAGYYISYQTEKPENVIVITDLLTEFKKRNAELRFNNHLSILAEQIKQSTLQFSIIRLRNAKS